MQLAQTLTALDTLDILIEFITTQGDREVVTETWGADAKDHDSARLLGWAFTWLAGSPGTAEIVCRATDATGESQPVEQSWNRQGMANNSVQRVHVEVREAAPDPVPSS